MKKSCLRVIKNLNYKNDPLLHKEGIFVQGYVNIYRALLKKKDFLNNKKGGILKRCPYASEKQNLILNLINNLRDHNFVTLKKLLSHYLEVKEIREDTFYSWLNKKTYPLPLIRLVCLLTKNNFLEILKDTLITNFFNQPRIRLPITYDDVTSDFMAYLIGLHYGDGTLNEERWKIVDGDTDSKNLRYSLEFQTNIKNKLKEVFSINPIISKIKFKNAYELRIPNKWFCRYLNFVYGIEFNQKENPTIPNILQNKKELVLRGLFDTDGSIRKYKVGVGTKFNYLYRNTCSILKEHGIKYRTKINNIKRKSIVYIIEIQKGDISKFITTIGFSHPRKLLEIKKYLLSTSNSRNFIDYKKSYNPNIPKEKFIELCNFIRPIKNGGKIRFISEFRKLKTTKKRELINNFKINFNVNKEPDSGGYVNSCKIERILTNYCIFKYTRNPTNNREIIKIAKSLNDIWH